MTDVGREALTDKRQATFDALIDATRSALSGGGFDGLTVRSVAAEAGVTHTTAYSFVTSKSQLVAELYLREIERLEAPRYADGTTASQRVHEALSGPATLFAKEPHVAHAVQVALLVGDDDPEVRRLRERIGKITQSRLRSALVDAPRDVVAIVFSAFNGAMIMAGTGDGRYDEVAPLAARLVDMLDLD